MKEIILTKGKVALVDDDDFEFINQWLWHVITCGGGGVFYASRTQKIPRPKAFLMHRVIINAPKGLMVDHINSNGLDNRRENLRLCTNGENMRNQRRKKDGFKGVTWHKRDKVWHAHISFNKHYMHIGYFQDPIEAAKAYDKKALELFGEFARPNFEA